ncbi:hypothetical protein G6F46_009180 [Rhizopus delemar]|uniref:UBA domain-containing protein n=2 Tax=Rhizopus TaxID=4842 RepID=A0A9P7CPQ3_9FUNG|nr:hypothetical protein G6F55_008726 [Rhizopus delemar]KAG1539206.1 hypothetical protein G6F51_009281 [Rhizopus arrhizus]KAG1500489.1 hypothetical protein G6F54_003678 [Rhizopus delemar]KAG1511997.1 hypothetical protein G6F53_005521 [Rhizopus delemar]KAG1527200.1 hypothetical protein G6F52_001744 [Rhizopus delemar]
MPDQGLTYSVLQNVPVMVSPHYRLPKKITIASELKLVPEDISQLAMYPFSAEKQAIEHIMASRKKSQEEEEAIRIKRNRYEQEKLNERKVAARRIAPGFLDTDTRILKPEQKHNHIMLGEDILQESPNQISSFVPADPWDTLENGFRASESVLSYPKANYSTPTNRTSFTQYQPRPYPKNEGAYWNIQKAQSSTHSSPAIPPKLFPPLPSSSTSSPIISHSIKPPPPPPVPPLPSDHLIEELMNMGFTQSQAMDALEKNEYNLVKATNFLLDQA